MKICICTTGPDLDSPIDQVFGRCSYFLFVDMETEEFKTVENEAKKAVGGAGIAAAQTVANEKAEVVIVGNVGPNALAVLEQSGIKVISGVSGTAKEALEKFKKGELEST
ncbi:NifB/NifX family molybdenum-iron cluster-binding protein [Patescibacteria group bacterium]|nr:NifB/NifX family molybdenum-iron cluster-binding protein [Patescibacteria group bacterium]